jgi:hypothetical protein
VLYDPAIFHLDQAICHGRDVRVVCDHDDGHTFLAIELAEQLHHFGAALAVQIACRLVGQNQAGTIDEGASDRYALLLASAELPWPMAGSMRQPDLFESSQRALATFL